MRHVNEYVDYKFCVNTVNLKMAPLKKSIFIKCFNFLIFYIKVVRVSSSEMSVRVDDSGIILRHSTDFINMGDVRTKQKKKKIFSIM